MPFRVRVDALATIGLPWHVQDVSTNNFVEFVAFATSRSVWVSPKHDAGLFIVSKIRTVAKIVALLLEPSLKRVLHVVEVHAVSCCVHNRLPLAFNLTNVLKFGYSELSHPR